MVQAADLWNRDDRAERGGDDAQRGMPEHGGGPSHTREADGHGESAVGVPQRSSVPRGRHARRRATLSRPTSQNRSLRQEALHAVVRQTNLCPLSFDHITGGGRQHDIQCVLVSGQRERLAMFGFSDHRPITGPAQGGLHGHPAPA